MRLRRKLMANGIATCILLVLWSSTNLVGANGQEQQADDLSPAASDLSSASSGSHKVVASGWPSTSQMWPSTETMGGATSNSSNWLELVEPFIYADKPRTIDYSLLLTLNKTVLNILKSQLKPMAVNLSFEYYFSHDSRVTAKPGIKIEVDRKQFRYLEPDNLQIKSRLWMRFNEKISIYDPSQFDNHDWLKFSLVNRQSPSLVAIRHLKIEFLMGDPQTTGSNNPSQSLPAPEQPQQPPLPASNLPVAPHDPRTGLEPQVNYPPQAVEPAQLPPAAQSPQPAPPQQPAEPQGPTYVQPVEPYVPPSASSGGIPPASAADNLQPAASDINISKVKPADESTGKGKKSWFSFGGGRRKKRDVTSEIQTNSTGSIVLTCFQADDCDWRTDSSEQMQWSLARMPPSTSAVHSGYYYASNRLNYGDAAEMFRLYLNQTDSATIADQNSDHCLELALYITEGSRLNLYQLRRLSPEASEAWTKGNLLLSWAPTLATTTAASGRMLRRRMGLPNSRLTAMEEARNGFTLETLCFGDFFADLSPRDCGSGRCAFGFEMTTWDGRQVTPDGRSTGEQATSGPPLAAGDGQSAPAEPAPAAAPPVEQVVAVAILQDHSRNRPAPSGTRPKWLQTWERDEVNPGDNWKFYPRMDYAIQPNNISLLNLFDGARYAIESDWLNADRHLEFGAVLAISPVALSAETLRNLSSLCDRLAAETLNSNEPPRGPEVGLAAGSSQVGGETKVFSVSLEVKLMDPSYNSIYSNKSLVEWSARTNETQLLNLSLPVSEKLEQSPGTSLFKIVLELIMDTHELSSPLDKFLADNRISYQLQVANVSLSDRCHPNPCSFGACRQNSTGLEDWNCLCEEKHRGRRCEFGRWCNLPHIVPWSPPPVGANGASSRPLAGSSSPAAAQLSSASRSLGASQSKQLGGESAARVSGREYCQRKLGPGFRCTDIDSPLDEALHFEEDRTFSCSCQDDYYLSDDSKCRQAHPCNSIICPNIGTICDETRAFNKSRPCHCDERQDWHADARDPSRCVRRQCQDKQRDCGFDAHICLPTLPGERPICKCGPNFALRVGERGQKHCQSTACVLPTLNECQQICLPDNNNLERPYTCACHPGFVLDPIDGRSCRRQRPQAPGHVCKPACPMDTQICTELGCRCKQGFVGEGEVRVQISRNKQQPLVGSNSSSYLEDYTQSIRCLNVCSLTYAENKEEFERIESVCPLGLCDSSNFQCRCSDPQSSALINTKYEPIYDTDPKALNSTDGTTNHQEAGKSASRKSPLCHLRRVCEPDSTSYKICKSQGAICVPDYTKAAMFDCVCPPSTEKRIYGQATVSEFSCEPRCSSKRSECLRRQAVCRLIDRDEVKCECLPGLMFDPHDQKCYLAKYSYSFDLLIINRYYEPESKFHKLELVTSGAGNATSGSSQQMDPQIEGPRLFEAPNQRQPVERPELNELVPQFNQAPSARSIFITEYNQCNITQVIPKTVIDDPYEHDMESYLSYIDQCNEKIHQNVRTYHLNSKLAEDLRQSLRQHLSDFTVTTSNSSCREIDSSGMTLNCTVYLQSQEPVPMSTIETVFNDCDKHAQDDRYCWIKPRLLLKHPDQRLFSSLSNTTQLKRSELNFKQVVPCELDNFCGQDAYSVRHDDKTSLCSCKCPIDIEAVDVKDLEPRQHEHLELRPPSVKEICAPRNHCGANSTYCLGKTGSVCQYDVRLGSRCQCVYPSYEDSAGKCVEITFSQLDSTLIVIIIMLGTGLIVSIAINLAVVAKTKSVFGRSKQYPLNEFSSQRAQQSAHLPNRSTGMPNPVFTSD